MRGENKTLFDRACKATDNLKAAEKAQAEAQMETKNINLKMKSMYKSMAGTQSHIETILKSNEDLTIRNKKLKIEGTRKVQELIAVIKKEKDAKGLVEREVMESRKMISSLESKISLNGFFVCKTDLNKKGHKW